MPGRFALRAIAGWQSTKLPTWIVQSTLGTNRMSHLFDLHEYSVAGAKKNI
jgi:hypothetical protein